MPTIKLGEVFIKFFDQGWLEELGGQGFILKIKCYSSYLDFFTSIDLKNYLLFFFFVLSFSFIILCLYSLNRAWR